MKKIIFFLFFLITCSQDKSPKENDTHANVEEVATEEPETKEEEVEEPIGIIAADDCQHINLGDKPCNIRLYNQNNDIWDMYDHKGDIILLDFSASWCGPCQIAAQHMQSLQDDYQNDGVQIVTILVDGPTGGVAPTDQDIDDWVSTSNITSAPVLKGSRDLIIDYTGYAGYNLRAYPTYIYIDRNMRFYAGHTGFSDAYVRERIEEALQLTLPRTYVMLYAEVGLHGQLYD